MKTFFSFLIILSAQAYAQMPLSNDRDSVFRNLDSGKKLILLGELHNKQNNDEILYELLNQMNVNNIFPDYILLEHGYGFTYIMNKYISDTSYYINYPLFLSKNEMWLFNLLKTKFEINNRKIIIYGVDYERDESYTVEALNILFKKVDLKSVNEDSVFGQQLFYLLDEFYGFRKYAAKRKEMYRTISDFLEFYRENDFAVNSLLGKELNDFKLIIASFYKYIDYATLNYAQKKNELFSEREHFIANNIYKLYQDNPEKIMLGKFGMLHVCLANSHYIKKDFTSFCELLNTSNQYKELNGKISSGVILYKKSRNKYYPHLNSKQFNDLKNKKKTSPQFSIFQVNTPYFDFIVTD